MNIRLENGQPVATLANGAELVGVCDGAYYSFRGIRYATAARFLPPVPAVFSGRSDCTQFGKKSMQVFDKPNPWQPPQDASEFSEDSLFLNIYIPAADADALIAGDADAPLPVLVNIHGGSFQDGSGNGKTPDAVIRDNHFIFVTLNYRMGIFGYAYLKNLLGDAYAASGNAGTLDQMAALHFVHENIAIFGGDPSRVTVMGESAGGKSIGTLMLLPEFDALASQVILSSGATQAVRSAETADKMTRMFLASMKKVAGTDDPAALLSMDPFELVQVQKDFIDNPGSTCMFGPVADGITLPDDPLALILEGTAFTGNAMLGSSLHELCFAKLMGNVDMREAGPVQADWLFGTNSAIAKQDYADFVAAHPEATDEEQQDFWVKILSDYMYRTYTERLAARLAAKGNKVWQYEVALFPAFHVFDQMLAFTLGVEQAPFFPDDETKAAAAATGAAIHQSFVRFVETGTPAANPTDWPKLDNANPVKMVWDKENSIQPVSALPTLQNFPEDVYRL